MKGTSSAALAKAHRAARPEKEKGIYRHDYGNTHGYRAYIKFRGVEHQKFFGDSGAPQKALRKARHWRKLKLRTLQAKNSSPLKKLAVNNKSGVIGVCRSGNSWQAAWVEKGVNRNRKFAVDKYGDREAFRLACRVRALAEQRLYGTVAQPRLRRFADKED